jgi:hypothetical protein
MVPGNQANARLSDKSIPLSGRTASAVVEGESTLPLLFDRALENGDVVGFAEVG